MNSILYLFNNLSYIKWYDLNYSIKLSRKEILNSYINNIRLKGSSETIRGHYNMYFTGKYNRYNISNIINPGRKYNKDYPLIYKIEKENTNIIVRYSPKYINNNSPSALLRGFNSQLNLRHNCLIFKRFNSTVNNPFSKRRGGDGLSVKQIGYNLNTKDKFTKIFYNKNIKPILKYYSLYNDRLIIYKELKNKIDIYC